jgi:methionyl-tRNA synthetase
LVLKVDIGTEVRTIVSGIAENYAPEAIVGQKVTVLCNLKPRALRGVESQGMILMAKANDGQLVFVQPDEAHPTPSGMPIS